MEATWMFINTWMDKEDEAPIYNGILLSHQKEWNNVICNNIDYHTKWNESYREWEIYDITYVWNLTNDTNELIYKKETDS